MMKAGFRSFALFVVQSETLEDLGASLIQKPPKALLIACRNLGQDIVQRAHALDDSAALALMVETALVGLEKSDAERIRVFVSEVFAARRSDAELLEFWASMPGEVWFVNGRSVAWFLSALAARLSQPPYLD